MVNVVLQVPVKLPVPVIVISGSPAFTRSLEYVTVCVSIHQNSYQDSAVYGPQVFYYEDSLQGKKMAELIQTELNTRLEVKRPREAKGNKTYYLLKRSESVLNIVECGFLTNPQEAELLQTEEYQQKVAEAVAEGICTYLEQQDIK